MTTPPDLLRRLSERGRPRGAGEVYANALSKPVVAPRVLVAAAVVLAVLAAGGVVVAGGDDGPGRVPERAEIAHAPEPSEASRPGDVTVSPDREASEVPPAGDASGVAPLDDGDAVMTHLQQHASCDALLHRLRDLGTAAVGPYGFDHGGAAPQAGEAGAAPASGEQADAGTASTHSSSNVQEPGVDEPDVVKTDGEIVVALARGRVQVVSVTDRALSASTAVGFQPVSLLLAGRTAAVIGVPVLDEEHGQPQTPVALVGLEDPTAPEHRRTTWIEGIVRSARMEDGMIRLVVADSPRFDWAAPADGSPGAASSAEAENRRMVGSSQLGAWLPDQRTVDPAGKLLSAGSVASCQTTYTTSARSGLDTTTVVTLDPRSGSLHPGAAVAATPHLVYATRRSLYIVSSACCPESPEDSRADIHRFDLSEPTTAPYRSSGSVLGAPVDQFALSERDGHLRVATSYVTGERSEGADRPVAPDTDSAVWVLTERGADLAIVGSVTGLGKPGEQIYAVRYHDRFAYVVTFRQTDPLYVVDLGEPSAPTVLGELEVPGFSTFLQAVGPGRLMGIGRSVDGSGQDRGLQLSLFDVADPARPSRADVLSYEQAMSTAEHDHLAFLHWEPADLVVVPMLEAGADPCRGFAGALMIRLDGSSLSEAGRISHAGHVPDSEEGAEAVVPIHRALVAGASLLTVSDIGLAFGDLRTGAEQAFVSFAGAARPHHLPCREQPARESEPEPDRRLPV